VRGVSDPDVGIKSGTGCMAERNRRRRRLPQSLFCAKAVRRVGVLTHRLEKPRRVRPHPTAGVITEAEDGHPPVAVTLLDDEAELFVNGDGAGHARDR
jgi:hypothetical protein